MRCSGGSSGQPSGLYTVTAPGVGSVELNFSMSAAQVQSALVTLYGFADLRVRETRTANDVTYLVSFGGAQSGLDLPQLAITETGKLVAALDKTVASSFDTVRNGAVVNPVNRRRR